VRGLSILLLLLLLLLPATLAGCLGDDDDDDSAADDDDSAIGDDDDAVEVIPCPEGLADAVDTNTGCVRGLAEDGLTVFRGVPYAEPPIGALRWRRTEPVAPWSEPLQAYVFGQVCLQANGTLVGDLGPGDGGEDCLFLNVWTPDVAGDGPILFFTHGGSHVDGAGSQALYDGAELAARGAVVVTHNYRLSSFGFLAHPLLTAEDPEGTSGNAGLFDSLAALEWIHANAAAFGGDPDRLMIFGESAGSLSTCALLLMPQARGLFTSAIAQSGACGFLHKPLSGASDDETAEQFGQRFAGELGCDGDDDVLACMRAADAGVVLDTLRGRDGLTGDGEAYGPNVDGVLLTGPARALISAGELAPVPLMVGGTADEATVFTAGFDVDTVETSQQVVGWYAYALDFDVAATQALYHPDGYTSPRAAFDAFYGDVSWHCPNRSLLRAAGAFAPVWRYTFDVVRPWMEDWGACHGCELQFVFGTGVAMTDDDEALAETMQQAWIAMASDGAPRSDATGDWPAFTEDSESYILLAYPLFAGAGWRQEQCDFLDGQGWHLYP
jgi:para-nitrobenzyl esterase